MPRPPLDDFQPEILDSGIFGCYAAGMDDNLSRWRLRLRRLLRAIRRENGLTQAELAERLGLFRQVVSKWERGQRDVGFFEVEDFCKAVGMSFESFVVRWEATPDESPPTQDPGSA